jgi:hypothetical protein
LIWWVEEAGKAAVIGAEFGGGWGTPEVAKVTSAEEREKRVSKLVFLDQILI